LASALVHEDADLTDQGIGNRHLVMAESGNGELTDIKNSILAPDDFDIFDTMC